MSFGSKFEHMFNDLQLVNDENVKKAVDLGNEFEVDLGWAELI